MHNIADVPELQHLSLVPVCGLSQQRYGENWHINKFITVKSE